MKENRERKRRIYKYDNLVASAFYSSIDIKFILALLSSMTGSRSRRLERGYGAQ